MQYNQFNYGQSNKDKTTSSINMSIKERNISTIGGVALLVAALLKGDRLGVVMGALGVDLLYRGITGYSLVYKVLGHNSAVHDESAQISVPHQQGIHLSQSVTINRPISEVYNFWRNFTNLPNFMKHLESVEVLGDNRSRWRVKGPAGMTIEWEAEIINEVPNTVIGWRSLENPYVDHAGSVRFKEASAGQGTELYVEMEYIPMAGSLGRVVAGLLGELPEKQVRDDLHRLKQHLEVGAIATVKGQPSGRK